MPDDCSGGHAVPVAHKAEECRAGGIQMGGVGCRPPRKYYKLTDKGMKFLNGLTQTWEELVRSTELIVSRSKKLLNETSL